jgi:hypothetical protein
MVGKDMESFLIIDTNGTIVQNLHHLEHNLIMNDNINFQDARPS